MNCPGLDYPCCCQRETFPIARGWRQEHFGPDFGPEFGRQHWNTDVLESYFASLFLRCLLRRGTGSRTETQAIRPRHDYFDP